MDDNCLACNGTNKVDSSFLYLLAFKHDIQRRKDIPESVRGLAVALINRFILPLKDIPGNLELAARRGVSGEQPYSICHGKGGNNKRRKLC